MSLRYYLPTGAEFRAARKRLQGPPLPDADSARRDRSPVDRDLVDRLVDPFETVDGVHDRLAGVETYLRERGDRRSVFLTVYVAMTDLVRQGIESGGFADPAWVRDYLVAFAERYREALVAFERGRSREVPPPWRIAFGASTGDDTLVIQDALLGIDAHINYDLALALDDVGIDGNRRRKRADHDAVNGVLRQLADTVQRTLASVYAAEGLTRADELLGPLDEQFTLLGLVESRDLAWRNAVLLADGRLPLARPYVELRLRVVSEGVAYLILSPNVHPSLLRELREFERGGAPLGDVVGEFRERVASADFDAGSDAVPDR